MDVIIKLADREEEFSQIFRLNYETFVEEIPQHEANRNRVLVDKFHTTNKYVIALLNKRVVGMLCINDERPFSLESILRDFYGYFPVGAIMCEIRLLLLKLYKLPIIKYYRMTIK